MSLLIIPSIKLPWPHAAGPFHKRLVQSNQPSEGEGGGGRGGAGLLLLAISYLPAQMLIQGERACVCVFISLEMQVKPKTNFPHLFFYL